MSKRFRFDDSGDSDDLRALFDSIAAQPGGRLPQSPPRETHVEVVGGTAAAGDSPELEALFESVAGQIAAPAARRTPAPEVAPAPEAATAQAAGVFQRLGQMTRQLHDTLRELGFDRALTPPLTVKHKGVGVTSVTRLAEAVERISQNRY